MSRRIKSIKGLFGQLIHYEGGVKVGESWPGLFSGSLNHYDADGRYVGYADCGIIADLVHHDEYGEYIGETHTGFFGQKKHYDAERGYIGETWEGFVGDVTELDEAADSFDSDEW